ncbi:hydroxyacylglutathione hydrolase [Pseudomonas sp.]|uniref:hydroxyacylglutathione hydrolase n=1 Tax=Pseudomonas sp. TaxID=306 RepID=UPI000F03F7A2|nr:Hydroxyacylglutathione hydrolase GloB [Pseudomonas fluorescens]
MTAGTVQSLDVIALPAFEDNYIWLLADPQLRECVVVDPGDATPVINWLQSHPQWRLRDILITHHHSDHVDGVAVLKERYGVRVLGPATEPIPCRDIALHEADHVVVLGRTVNTIAVPGHTLGHIAYYLPDEAVLFTGDTLFAGGCGRLFEGTAAQMLNSLERLAALPEATRVYCAHEYTLSNLRFAHLVEPGNRAIENRLRAVEIRRAQGQCTLPSSIAIERATNPFLRTRLPTLWERLESHTQSSVGSSLACMVALRGWKDIF